MDNLPNKFKGSPVDLLVPNFFCLELKLTP